MEEPKLNWRERLADAIRPKDEPDASVSTPAVTVPTKKSNAIPRWMRDMSSGASVDSDGQVLRPSQDQRGTAGWLSSIFPRGPHA
jgi:hypothetical protein